MQWSNVISTQNDDAWFEDYVRVALASQPPKLPERTMRLGAVQAGWFPTLPATAHIFATGGTPLDRRYAYMIIAAQLEGHGIKPALYSLDWDLADGQLIRESSLGERNAGWPDIQSKATRLIQGGKVKIVRNSREIVAGVVEGDHGTYNTEIQRQDPTSQSISMWSCECLVPGTLITMYDGSTKPVEEIVAGDVVLTATGRAGVVRRTFEREYTGFLVGLKITGSTETVWMTEEHLLPTADIEFKRAVDWQEGDFSYLPLPEYPRITEIDVAKHVPGLIEQDGWLYKPNRLFGSRRVAKGRRPPSPISPRQKPIPAHIKWDCSFAYIAGLFVAEGIATPRGELRWSFNAKTEQRLADHVIEMLVKYGLDNAKKKTSNGAVTVAVQSKPMADLFRSLFGTGSKTKRLSLDVMGMEQLALASFFGGWFDGDGHEGQNQRDTLATASPHLAMQARLILARCGHESVIRVKHNNVSSLVPNGTDLYVLNWRRDGGHGRGVRFYEDRQVYQQMDVPIERQYKGTVHNFEVIGDHTYVIAPGIASANCKWDQFAWQRTRQWKRLEGRVCSHVLATCWQSRGTPLDEEIGPGAEEPPPAPEGGAEGAPAPQEGTPQPAPSPFAQVPGGGTGMVPPAGTPGPAKPGAPNQVAPAPEPAGVVPGQAPEPQSLIPQYPHDPALQPAINPVSVPGQKPQTPLNPIQNPGGTFSHVAAEQQFTNGNMVQLKQADHGQTVGLGAGDTKEIPANSIGEVLGTDPLGLVNVYFAGPQAEAGRLEPHGVTGWFWPNDLIARPDIPAAGPAVRRR